MIQKDLVTLFGVMKSLYYVSLRRHLESKLEYKMIVQNDDCDITVLHNLIRKAYSVSTLVIASNIAGTILEA